MGRLKEAIGRDSLEVFFNRLERDRDYLNLGSGFQDGGEGRLGSWNGLGLGYPLDLEMKEKV